jgi:hypothetical protein
MIIAAIRPWNIVTRATSNGDAGGGEVFPQRVALLGWIGRQETPRNARQQSHADRDDD